MALYVRRDDKRSQLQEKLAADLKNKLDTSGIKAETTDPTILEDAHQTRPAGLIIGFLLLLVVVAAIVTMFILG